MAFCRIFDRYLVRFLIGSKQKAEHVSCASQTLAYCCCLSLLLMATSVFSSVDVGLSFAIEPSDVIVQNGSSFIWNCSAVSSSQRHPNISWVQEGHEISEQRRTVLSNGSLRFRKVIQRPLRRQSDEERPSRKPSDEEGFYECIATNDIGAIVSRPAKLNIAHIAMDSPSTEPQQLEVGELARFVCGIFGLPVPTITWSYNGSDLPVQETSRFLQLNSGVLQIFPIEYSDAGVYQCHGANEAGIRQGPRLQLIVSQSTIGYRPPKWRVGPPMNTTAVVGQSIQWECVVSSRDANVIWSRQYYQKVFNNRVRLIGRSNLEIVNVTLLDTGIYQCMQVTEGIMHSLGAVELDVVELPRIIQRSPNTVATVGSKVTLECEFDGLQMNDDSVGVTWSKDGDGIKERHRVQVASNEIRIMTVQPSDAGLYQCWAENAAGHSYEIIRLVVEPSADIPLPPVNLFAHSVTSRSVSLNWTAPPARNNISIVAYAVHYKPQLSELDGQQLVFVQPFATIDQLLPYTNYTFYVLTYNLRTHSLPSDIITVQTGEEVPVSVPNVTLVVINATAMQAFWSELPRNHARGQITHYKVLYRATDGSASLPVVIETNNNQRHYILNNLVIGKTYEVLVLPCTRPGCTEVNSRWSWATQTIRPSVSPVTLHCDPVNETTVSLTWPSNTSSLPYTVKFSVVGHKATRSITSASETLVVTGLEQFTEYQFTVYSPGSSERPMFERVQCRTTAGFPTEPVDVSASAVVSSSGQANLVDILLSWKPPMQTNGIITSYRVFWSVTGGELPDTHWNSKSVNGSTTRVVIYDVSVATKFCYVKLSASTVRGFGQQTSVLVINTVITPAAALTDWHVGIIVGVTVGVLCIVICVTVLVCKSRVQRHGSTLYMSTRPTAPSDGYTAPGPVLTTLTTGNHCNHHVPRHNDSDSNCLTPMLHSDSETLSVAWHQHGTTPLSINNKHADKRKHAVNNDDSTMPLCIDTSMSFTTSNVDVDSPCDKLTAADLVGVIDTAAVSDDNVTVVNLNNEIDTNNVNSNNNDHASLPVGDN